MTDKFSWNRFFRFARAEQAGERREMLLKLGGFVAFCFVMYMLLNWGSFSVNVNGQSDLDMASNVPRGIVMFGVMVITYLNISSGFKRYFIPSRASELLMLPVAKSEKFLFVALRNMVVIPLILIAIVLLNDLAWAHVLGIDSWPKLMTEGIDMFQHLSVDDQLNAMLGGVMFFVYTGIGLAFYFLGSVFFRRRQFLFTFLSSFLLFGFIGNPSGKDYLKEIPTSITEANISTAMGLIILIGLFLVSLLIYLAWRRYSTLQITK